MSDAKCWISAEDYYRYFGGPMPSSLRERTEPPYTGPERRVSGMLTRRLGHDRRWQAATGRRFSVFVDRRRR